MSEGDDPGTFLDADIRAADPNIRILRPLATDADRATDLRARMMTVLGEVVAIIDEAKLNHIRIGFQLSPPDAFGKHHVLLLEILKEL